MKKLLTILLLFISFLSFGQERIKLIWSPSTDNVGVAGYCVWVDGERWDSTEINEYVIDLPAGTFILTVSAYDAAGNESAQSEEFPVTILDVTTPAIPELISIQYLEDAVKVSWLKSIDNVGVAGYYLYVNGNRFASTTDNYYEFRNIIPDSEYKLSISAYDNAGNESEKTTEFDIRFPDDNLVMKVYPNPVTKGIFKVLFDGGIIKENSTIQILGLDGKILFERLVPAGLTPYEMDFNLEYLFGEGIYGIVFLVNGKRVLNAFLVVSKPRYYSTKLLLEMLELE